MSEVKPAGTEVEVGVPARLSRRAAWSMFLGIVGLVGAVWLVGAVIGLVAMIVGEMARRAIDKDPARSAGKGFAQTGMLMGAGSLILTLLMVATPSMCHGGGRELANRSACAANVSGTIKGFIVYANENLGVYPTAGNPASVGTYSTTMGVVSTATDPATALRQEQTTAGAVANPTAILWMLVLQEMETPKSLICKSDPAASSTPSPTTDPSRHYYLTPAAANQISYSIAYPYDSAKTVGAWWKNSTLSDLPVMSEMTPMDGTGNPVRTLTATAVSNNKTWNSFNHNGDGQNVGFADAHVEWRTNPHCGQGGDNIFTTGQGSEQRAGTPGAVTPITTSSPPFDTIMVPVRDGSTLLLR